MANPQHLTGLPHPNEIYPVPPVGVFMIAGCGADLLINVCLTILGYFPGHIHAFYLEYVYYDRQEKGECRPLRLPST